MFDNRVIPLPLGRVVVVTIDQRASRSTPDLVDRTRRMLNHEYVRSLARPFDRTAGDEMQAVGSELGWLVELLLAETRRATWWIGVGLGAVEGELGRTARESRGEAFYRARDAVQRAKQAPWGFAIDGGPALERVERCLVAASWIVRKRTDAQHEAATLLQIEGQSNRVARRLGISEPSVSQRLRGAGIAEEAAARRLALDLLRDAAAA